MSEINHKRGDTFHYVAALPDTVDLAGATAKCQVRTVAGAPIDDIDVELRPDKTLTLRKQITTHWPIGPAALDVQFTLANGDVVSTDTVSVQIKRDVTL